MQSTDWYRQLPSFGKPSRCYLTSSLLSQYLLGLPNEGTHICRQSPWALSSSRMTLLVPGPTFKKSLISNFPWPLQANKDFSFQVVGYTLLDGELECFQAQKVSARSWRGLLSSRSRRPFRDLTSAILLTPCAFPIISFESRSNVTGMLRLRA